MFLAPSLSQYNTQRRSTNIHWNIHLKMSQCRQNLGRHEALIVFTLIHIGTVLSDFSNVFKSLFHDITPVFTHGSNHKSSSITQIVKNLRLYFLWEFIERWCACKGEYLSVCSKSIFLFCNSAEMYIYANLQKYFTNLQNHLKFDWFNFIFSSVISNPASKIIQTDTSCLFIYLYGSTPHSLESGGIRG